MGKYLNPRHIIAQGLIFAFLLNSLGPMPAAQAQDFRLPAPGSMVPLSPAFNPPILKGIKVHPDNPFRFDFILDQGDEGAQAHKSTGTQEEIKSEAAKLIKYFLASLTIPEKDLWVNLSPYEKNRIVPESFGQTEMGRDLLAEDYMLKQITASLIYPEGEVGKKFWKRIYEEAAKKFGTTNIPVNTFNKVWIVPEKAVVYENAKAGTAYVVESKLKVMLEQDYLALEKNTKTVSFPNVSVGNPGNAQTLDPRLKHSGVTDVSNLGSQIVREIVIPELTKEVNSGQNFAQLRQVYNSLILATWYKKKIKDSILAQVYADKKKVVGVGYEKSVILSEAKDLKVLKDSSVATLPQNDNDVELIYQRYLQAFKKGAYNYIKEEVDPISQQTIPRKYFSGGWVGRFAPNSISYVDHLDQAQISSDADLLQVINVHLQNSNYETKRDHAMAKEDIDAQLKAIREKIFGKGIDEWLARYSRGGEGLKAEELTLSNLYRYPKVLQYIYDRQNISKLMKGAITDLIPLLDPLDSRGNRDRIIKYAVEHNKFFKMRDLIQDLSRQGIPVEMTDWRGLRRYVGFRSVLELPEIQDYLNNETFQQLNKKARLAGLKTEVMKFLPEFRQGLYNSLPEDIARQVDGENLKELLKEVLEHPLIQTYIASDEFKLIDPNDRLVGFAEKAWELGFPLDRWNLATIYAFLPVELKRQVSMVSVSLKVSRQIRAALSNEQVKKFLETNRDGKLKERLDIDDLLKEINATGIHLPAMHPSTLYNALPRWVRDIVFVINRTYITNQDGKLLVRSHRSSWRDYNFSKIHINGLSWDNRRVFPLWDASGEIKVFEIRDFGLQTIRINAADVIEGRVSVGKAVIQYIDDERRKEVVAHGPNSEYIIETRQIYQRLHRAIRNYSGAGDNTVDEYLGFLVSLSDLKSVEGINTEDRLTQAVSENGIDRDQGIKFLQYMMSPLVHSQGIDIKAILAEDLVSYLTVEGSDLAMAVDAAMIDNPWASMDSARVTAFAQKLIRSIGPGPKIKLDETVYLKKAGMLKRPMTLGSARHLFRKIVFVWDLKEDSKEFRGMDAQTKDEFRKLKKGLEDVLFFILENHIFARVPGNNFIFTQADHVLIDPIVETFQKNKYFEKNFRTVDQYSNLDTTLFLDMLWMSFNVKQEGNAFTFKLRDPLGIADNYKESRLLADAARTGVGGRDGAMKVDKVFSQRGAIKYFEGMMFRSEMADDEVGGIARVSRNNGTLNMQVNPTASHAEMMKAADDTEWISITFAWDKEGKLKSMLLLPPSKTGLHDEKYTHDIYLEIINIAQLTEKAAIKQGVNPHEVEIMISGGFEKSFGLQQMTPLDVLANVSNAAMTGGEGGKASMRRDGAMVEQPETLKYAVSELQTALKRHPFSVFLAEPGHRELSVALDVSQDSQGRTFSRTMVRVYPFAKDDKIKQEQGVHGFPELKGIYHNLQLKDEFMPPSGTIGQITFFIILDKDGHAVLVFEENQPSYGFRHIKPSSAQKPYFIWVEALQKHIIGLAKQIGINQIYSLSRDAISQVYLYNHTSTSTHFDPYKRPYRKPHWQPKMVDVSTIYPFMPPGKQISVWEYANAAMKGGDVAMTAIDVNAKVSHDAAMFGMMIMSGAIALSGGVLVIWLHRQGKISGQEDIEFSGILRSLDHDKIFSYINRKFGRKKAFSKLLRLKAIYIDQEDDILGLFTTKYIRDPVMWESIKRNIGVKDYDPELIVGLLWALVEFAEGSKQIKAVSRFIEEITKNRRYQNIRIVQDTIEESRTKIAKEGTDLAMNGGIDLTSDKALSVQNSGQGIKFHLDPAQLAQLQNAPGFVPVIINIQPLESLQEFLGVSSGIGAEKEEII